MKRWEVILLHASTLAIGLSGLAYAVMKYFLTGSDPDSALGHPWQPSALKMHVLAAPFIVFALGLVVRGHALPKLRLGEAIGRSTGLSLLWILAPLVLSGYAIQALTGDVARKGTGWGHTGVGVLFLVAYLAHLLKPSPSALRRAPESAGATGER